MIVNSFFKILLKKFFRLQSFLKSLQIYYLPRSPTGCSEKCEEKFSSLEAELAIIKDKLEVSEQYTRRNNLRFYGLKETQGEDLHKEIHKLCETIGVPLPSGVISVCHRLPGRVDGTRPVIAVFVSRSVRDTIYKNKAKLKGSAVVIREDLTTTRLSLFQKAYSYFGNKRVWTNYGKIMCNLNNKVVVIKNTEHLNSLKVDISKD